MDDLYLLEFSLGGERSVGKSIQSFDQEAILKVDINENNSIGVVDDHSVISAGLQSILLRFPRISVVGTFTDGNDFLTYLKNNDPNLVLLDLDLPQLHGIEILRSMKLSKPYIQVAVFTQHDGEYYFHEATQLGVNGYILKSENIYAIPEILVRIHKGEYYNPER